MTNTQFTFRRSWLEAINLIKAKSVRNRLLTVIVEYGLNRTYSPIGNTAADAIMLLIIDQIDSAEQATTPGGDSIPFGGDSVPLSQEFTDRNETYRRDAGTPDEVRSSKIVHRASSIVHRPIPGGDSVSFGGDSVPLSQDSTERDETYRRDAGTPDETCSPKLRLGKSPGIPASCRYVHPSKRRQSQILYRRDAGTPKPKEAYKKKSRSKKKKRLARRRKHRK